MKTIFFVLAVSSVARSQSVTDLLFCGDRQNSFKVEQNPSNTDGPKWVGRVGGAGIVDDGKYSGVKISLRREGDQCFFEVSGADRTMRFEYWIGSDLADLKALTNTRSSLSEKDRTCHVGLMYKDSLSNCDNPVQIINERPVVSSRYNCEITSYSNRLASEIDFIAKGSSNVCVGRTKCVAKVIMDDDRPTPPPYESYVACLPASNGECLQSYKNCGGDERTYPKDDVANQKMRRTLNLPPSRGKQ
jgi:hypothetical protein